MYAWTTCAYVPGVAFSAWEVDQLAHGRPKWVQRAGSFPISQ